jgi:hypothetical protein
LFQPLTQRGVVVMLTSLIDGTRPRMLVATYCDPGGNRRAAATRTGLDPSLLKKMLPVLVMLVGSYIAKRGGRAADPAASGPSGGGGLGDLLGGVLAGGKAGAARGSGGIGGLASMLDLDGDGNPLDDILGMAGKFTR